MKNKKVLIIGKNSLIGSNLYKFFTNKFRVMIDKFENIKNIRGYNQNFSNFDYIINCSSNKNYVKKKYDIRNDFDLKIANIIKNSNCKFIFISTRKVYKQGANLKETSKLSPKCNYSKNKLTSEKKILSLLGDRALILRTSNILGLCPVKLKKRKLHATFIDQFLLNINKNILFRNNKSYKDFLSIDKFSEITFKLIKKNMNGVFNVSCGQKIYLSSLVKWLNYNNPKKARYIKLPNKFKNENFYLNNDKLMNCIKIRLSINHLKKYCEKLSKDIFIKK